MTHYYSRLPRIWAGADEANSSFRLSPRVLILSCHILVGERREGGQSRAAERNCIGSGYPRGSHIWDPRYERRSGRGQL